MILTMKKVSAGRRARSALSSSRRTFFIQNLYSCEESICVCGLVCLEYLILLLDTITALHRTWYLGTSSCYLVLPREVVVEIEPGSEAQDRGHSNPVLYLHIFVSKGKFGSCQGRVRIHFPTHSIQVQVSCFKSKLSLPVSSWGRRRGFASSSPNTYW